MSFNTLRSVRRVGAFALALALGAACDSPNDTRPRVAARMEVLSGNVQEGTVGTELPDPLVVRVVDDRGRPVAGQIVNFRVVSGGGSVFAGTGQTNADGEVRERWTLGTSTAPADSQRVEARAVESSTGAPQVFAVFSARAKPDIPAQVLPLGGTTGAPRRGVAGTTLPDLLALQVGDRYFNPVPDVEVTWTAAPGSGSVSPTPSRTDSAGVARTAWTLGDTTGAQSVSASVAGFPPEMFSATAVAGQAARVTIMPRELRFATLGRRMSVSISATDALGNAVVGAPVTLVSLDAAVATLDRTSVQARGNGTTRLVATVQGTTASDTVSVRVEQVPASLTLTPQAAALFVGDTVRFRATVADSGGAVIPNQQVTWRSSADAVATVSASGLATGVSSGPVTITAQLGDAQASATVGVYVPLTGTSVVASHRSCALDDQGSAYCWPVDGRAYATPVPGGPPFVSLAEGEPITHWCALTSTGAAYCWGGNRRGELGDGTTTDRMTPVPVAGGITFAALAVSWRSTCGLAEDGTALCWGDAIQGQLGNGSTTKVQLTPEPVAGGLKFRMIAAGVGHYCGLTTEGAAYCWGFNSFGQAGQGDLYVLTPTPVAPESRFASITVGGYHSCALTDTGRPVCWGSSSSFGQVTDQSPRFSALTAGAAHTCGLTAAGEAFCWGGNLHGQQGIGAGQQHSPILPVSGGYRFARLSAGGDRTCGITLDGAVLCWGKALVGDGSEVDRRTPVPVVRF